MADARLAVRRADRPVQRHTVGPGDREAVVVGGDLDLAGRAVHHRLVDAAVAVLQLERAQAQRAPEELVAEADPEVGHTRLEHGLDGGHGVVGGRRVTGTVAGEDAVGGGREHLLGGGRAGQHVHLDAARGEHPRGVGLDAEVEGGDPERPRALGGRGRRDDVALRRRHLLGQRGPGHLRRGEDALEQARRVGLGRRDADPHGAALAQVAGQRTGVDGADADHALLAQVVVEAADRPPAAGHPGRVAHDVPADPDAARLGVVVVHAGVADVGSGHDHDLAVVRRVGERLLVAAHAGVEHRFAEGLPLGAVGVTVEGAAVLQDEDRRCARDHASYLLLRLTGRIVKGCRAPPTLSATLGGPP